MSFGGGGSFTIQGLIKLIASAQGLQQVQGQLQGLLAVADKGTSSFAKMGKTLQNTGRSLQQTGFRMSTAITAPLIGLGFAAGKAFVDFDNAFVKIAALVGIPEKELEQLRKQVLALGPDVAQTPIDLANALYFVVSSGFAANEAMAVVDASARAAAAGLGTTANVADLVTTAMNAYGHENLAAADATDILVAAVREGKAEPEEFAAALSKSIAQAALLGVSFDEVTASVATLTLAGVSASEAGTALNQMFSNLIKPTDKAREVLEQYGLSMQGLRDLLRTGGPVAVIRLLSETFGDNEEAMGAVFGNIRALRFANNILALSEAQVNKVFDATANSAGDADEAFKKASNSAGFKLKQQMVLLNEQLIQLGAVLIPLVIQGLQVIVPLVVKTGNAFAHLPPWLQKTILIFGAIVAAIGPLLIYLGFLVQAIGVLIAAFSAGGLLAGFGAAVVGVVAAIASIALPILLIVAALGVLFIAYHQNWFGFGDAVDKVAKQIAFAVGGLIDEFGFLVDQFMLFFKIQRGFKVQFMVAAFVALGQVLKRLTGINLLPMFHALGTGFQRPLNAFRKIAQAFSGIIKSAFKGDWSAVERNVEKLFAGIGDLLAAGPKLLGEFIDSFRTGVPAIDRVLHELGRVFVDVGRIVQEVFQGDWSGALKVGERLLKHFLLFFVDSFHLLPALLILAFKAIDWGAVGNLLVVGLKLAITALFGAETFLVNAGIQIMVGLLDGIFKFFTGVLTPWFLENMTDGTFKSFFVGANLWLFQVGWDIMTGLWLGIDAMVTWILIQLPQIQWKLVQAFAGAEWWLWQVGWDITAGIWNGMVAGMQWIYKNLWILLGPLPGWARKAIGANSPAKKLIIVGVEAMEGIAFGVEKSVKLVKDALEKAAGQIVVTGKSSLGAAAFLAGSTGPSPIAAGGAGSASSVASMGDVNFYISGNQDPEAIGDAVVSKLSGAFVRMTAQRKGAKR